LQRLIRATVFVALVSVFGVWGGGTAVAAQPIKSSCYQAGKCSGLGGMAGIWTSATGTTVRWAERDCWRREPHAPAVMWAPIKVRADGTFSYSGPVSSVFEAGVRATISGRFITPQKVRVVSTCSSAQRGVGATHTVTLSRQGSFRAPRTFPRPSLEPLPPPPAAPSLSLPPMTPAEAAAAAINYRQAQIPTFRDATASCTVTDADHATCSTSWNQTNVIPPMPGMPDVPPLNQHCEETGVQVIRNPPIQGLPAYVIQLTTMLTCTP
jgi:hypothetical protein